MTLPPFEIKALILDLFGVIVAFDDELAYDRIAQRCADSAGATDHMRNLVSEPSLICGRTSLREIHARLVEDLNLNASLNEFEEIWLSSYSEPMPGLRELMRQLMGQCNLVLLSNIDPYYWPVIESSIPELHGFHAKVLSFQEGISKPDRRAFERAVIASEVAVEKCYFVDDKPENIEAAASIGLAGHAFKSCRLLKSKLRQSGLRVQ